MAIDTILMLTITGVLWMLLMIFVITAISQNIHGYTRIMSKLEELEKRNKEMSTHVEYLYGVANGSCKPVDFQSYYPVDWTDAWEMLAQQAEDQALGEAGD